MDIVWENIIPYFTQPSQSQRDSRRSLTREENIEIQTEHKDIKSQPVAQLTVLEIPHLKIFYGCAKVSTVAAGGRNSLSGLQQTIEVILHPNDLSVLKDKKAFI